ncbi:hypothetical protein CTI14_42780, partial [Methylobacterium radiotolerans]
DRPDRSRLFMKLGIDYCCGGKLTLQDAAEKKGLDAASILATLTALETLEPAGSAPNPALMSLTALADHIVGTHHAYLKEELPRLAFLTRKVAAVHGDDHPWLRDRPDRSRLFMKLGIDYCCGGKLTLQDAAEKKGL